MKTYTIIGGVNGVGKSSLLGSMKMKYSDLGVIIDTDKLNAALGGDRVKGGKEALRLIDDCLHSGVDFTQETTLSGVRTLKTILRAKELGYYVRLFYLGVSSCEESLVRIKNRVSKGGHDIPEEDVRRRYERRTQSLSAVITYCNEVHFIDNENGFMEVGTYRGGEVICFGDRVPHWLLDMKKQLDIYA